jgi:cytoskeletal protein CcmA (bactofilin family)
VHRLLVLAAVLLALPLLAAPACAASLSGEADDDGVVVINGDVVVQPIETSKGVFIVDGDARISGRVDGDVVLVAGDALVGGTIDGDVVTISGRARLLPTAIVNGDVIYGDERPLVAPAATVAGKVEKADWTDSLGLLPFVGAFAFWLAVGISALVLGVLLLLIAPRAADATLVQARTRFWTGAGIGAGIFIALPVVAFVAAITLVGLPLAIGIGLALLPLAAIAYVTAAWALGRTIVKPPRGRILSFLVGLAILRVAALLPILGLLVWLGAVIVGLGLIGAAIAAARPEPAR